MTKQTAHTRRQMCVCVCHDTLVNHFEIERKKQVFVARMSSGYQALLKSLDETDDITRGLGRSIKLKKRRKGSSCCCCWCCSSRPWVMWSCISLAVFICMALSVGVPIMLTMPVESQWHWSHLIPKMAGTATTATAPTEKEPLQKDEQQV